MIIKMTTISILTAALLFAAAAVPSPISVGSRSTDNGGAKSAIDAYSDGAGVVVINQASATKLDNSAMNTLVFKYGEEAKLNNVSLKDQVQTVSTTSTASEKSIANKISTGSIGFTFADIPDNTLCNDGNAQTVNDRFLNGTCFGEAVPNGSSCNDGDSATSGETWLNGVCQGGVAGNVAGNGLIYDNCESGARNWADAGAYCASKGAGWRLPTLNETNKGASGASGVPQCSATTWSWTSTPTGGNYFVWSVGTYDNGGPSYAQGVRCVK